MQAVVQPQWNQVVQVQWVSKRELQIKLAVVIKEAPALSVESVRCSAHVRCQTPDVSRFLVRSTGFSVARARRQTGRVRFPTKFPKTRCVWLIHSLARGTLLASGRRASCLSECFTSNSFGVCRAGIVKLRAGSVLLVRTVFCQLC